MEIALVTGSSTGIGQSTALHLARSGFHVFATMRNPEAGVDLLTAYVLGVGGHRCPLAAQGTADTLPPLIIDGPAPPHPPDVISRDANGRATMRAIRLVEPLRVDGALNERVYLEVPPVTDFIQKEPVEGALATEKSEVWVLFDDEQLYISFRCWAERECRSRRLIDLP